MQARLAAIYVLYDVIVGGRSLSSTLNQQLNDIEKPADKGLCQEITYGTLRYYPSLKKTLAPFIKKRIPEKNQALEILLCCATYQLVVMKLPCYAVINESVAIVKPIDFAWANAFVNAVLRNLVRSEATLAHDQHHDHPEWLATKIIKAYPDQSTNLFANNHHAAFTMLRVRHGNRDTYLQKLAAQSINAKPHIDNKDCIVLTSPTTIPDLPDFASGGVTVQDANAQLAANLLSIKPNMHILDACAAPGGKTAHIADKADSLTITAIDNVASRVNTMQSTLARLDITANVITADVAETDTWHDGILFDRILLDAPCSATGVIRKHPDILFHRRASDIDDLVRTQAMLLDICWTLLKPNGRLLYATCSVLPEENLQQILSFLKKHPDATLKPLGHNRAISNEHGTLQFIPDEHGDGFFYAAIEKNHFPPASK